MSDFNAWRSWAAGLDEMAFARLWRALGAVAALRPMRGALDEWLDRVAAHAVQTGELGWTLPPFAEPFAQRLQGRRGKAAVLLARPLPVAAVDIDQQRAARPAVRAS